MIDEQVGAEAFIEHQPVILEALYRLSLHMQSPLLEGARQDGFID